MRGWRWLSRGVDLWTAAAIIVGLLGSGTMARFTSLEGAPWPVMILVSATVFALTSVGVLVLGSVVRRWFPAERPRTNVAVARAHLRFFPGRSVPEFRRGDNVISVGCAPNDRYTLTWDREFKDTDYDVTLTPSGCEAFLVDVQRGGVTIDVVGRQDREYEVRVRAEGEI